MKLVCPKIEVCCLYGNTLYHTNNNYYTYTRFSNWINIINFRFKVIFAVLQIIGCIILVLSIKHMGKRFLAVMSVSINTILLILFGLYIIALKKSYIASTPWIPTMILSGISLFGTSISTLPWMLIGEIFPNK